MKTIAYPTCVTVFRSSKINKERKEDVSKENSVIKRYYNPNPNKIIKKNLLSLQIFENKQLFRHTMVYDEITISKRY